MTTAQRTALIATTLLCVLALSSAARADWKLDRAKAVAAKAWNDPCPGRVQIDEAPLSQADWLASTLPAQCRITLARPLGWSLLCPVLVHEYGHLAGYRDPANLADPHHSSDPDSIMWPFLRADRRCERFGAPYLGLAPKPRGTRGGSASACRRPGTHRPGARRCRRPGGRSGP